MNIFQKNRLKSYSLGLYPSQKKAKKSRYQQKKIRKQKKRFRLKKFSLKWFFFLRFSTISQIISSFLFKKFKKFKKIFEFSKEMRRNEDQMREEIDEIFFAHIQKFSTKKRHLKCHVVETFFLAKFGKSFEKEIYASKN